MITYLIIIQHAVTVNCLAVEYQLVGINSNLIWNLPITGVQINL